MGWGRTLFLGNIGNRIDIGEVERDIAALRKEIRGAFYKDMSQDDMIRELINENAELKLYLASVVRLLCRKNVLSSEELKAMVHAVDAEDGADGRYQGDIL